MHLSTIVNKYLAITAINDKRDHNGDGETLEALTRRLQSVANRYE